METHETHMTPVMVTTFSDDGVAEENHVIRMVFSANNAFGSRERHTARGTVDPDTCEASLTLIEPS